MNRLIEKMCENRGYTRDYLSAIENGNHADLKDVDVMCEHLKHIKDSGVQITVYPDFDTDGVSSGIVGFAGLAELGFYVNLYVPDPAQGYGITVDSIKDLMSKYPDTKTVITCDTGIGAYDAMNYCKSIGVEMLVTDHHIQQKVGSASVIVDPLRIDETYEHSSICGAFVFYQVLQYYADHYENYFMQSQIQRLRVFAGIGTISDTMPVLYENRCLVRDCINICRWLYNEGSDYVALLITGSNAYRRAFWGLYSFMKVCERCGILKNIDDLNEDFFGFYLAPMINSVKRMDGDMNRAFGAFLGNDPGADAEYLYELNNDRKALVNCEYRNMLDAHQPYAPYIYITTVNPGIAGLLAMKAMSDKGAPCFVLIQHPEGHLSGSGRCPSWYTFSEDEHALMHMAGHAGAFGCYCNSMSDLTDFYNMLNNNVTAVINELGVNEPVYDFVIATDWSGDTGIDIYLFKEYLDEIGQLRPFGTDFPAPNIKFVFRNQDAVEWKKMGNAGQHLKITFANGFSLLCWNQGYLISEKNRCDIHELSGHLDISEYRGEENINFIGVFEGVTQ